MYWTRVAPIVVIKQVIIMRATTNFKSFAVTTATTYVAGGHAGVRQTISQTSSSISNCQNLLSLLLYISSSPSWARWTLQLAASGSDLWLLYLLCFHDIVFHVFHCILLKKETSKHLNSLVSKRSTRHICRKYTHQQKRWHLNTALVENWTVIQYWNYSKKWNRRWTQVKIFVVHMHNLTLTMFKWFTKVT